MATILLPESRHLQLGDKWLRVMGFVKACRTPHFRKHTVVSELELA